METNDNKLSLVANMASACKNAVCALKKKWYLLKNYVLLTRLYKKNEVIIARLQEKAKHDKIKVAFLVIFDSVFPAQNVYKLMKSEETIFAPSIIVVPDTLRGHDNLHNNMQKTYAYLKDLYGDDVILSYDMETREFRDLIDEFDICCPANPYDGMTYRYYRIERIRQHGLLLFYVNYGYPTVKYARNVFSRKELSYVWRYYTESDELADEYKKYSLIHATNTLTVGYCKMDSLAQYAETPHERKKIIIAPHHTVKRIANIFLSNFLELSNLFLELPARYPQIDFVFRPHPLLFSTLRSTDFWGDAKVEAYILKMQAYANVEYQDCGDYFEAFATADAIIHDCSSFVTEWMYTGKPGCYILKNENVIKEQFVEFGEKILQHYYHAFTREDILEFIDSVVLCGNDYKKDKRIAFADKYIKVNYPNSSSIIVADLTKNVMGDQG